MMKKSLLFCGISIFFLAGCKEIASSGYVLSGETALLASGTKEVSLSQLLSPDFALIPLESKEESLIGRIGKIVKHREHYYVLSNDRWVHRFDRNGRYTGQLSKVGGAPEEYNRIADFDVYTIDGRTELWLCDYNVIRIYDGESFEFIRSIPLSIIVHKFCRLADGDLLFMTGMEEQSLAWADPEGNIQMTYLEKENPFLTFKPVQFIPYGSQILFSLGVSNGFVAFDRDQKEFSRGLYSKKDNLLSPEELVRLYDQYQEDFLGKLKNYNYIRNIRKIKGKTWFDIYAKGRYCFASLDDSGNVISGFVREGKNIKNDLFAVDSMDFLLSLGWTISDDDSLIFYIEDEDIIHELNQQQALENPPGWGEGNPWLLVFY